MPGEGIVDSGCIVAHPSLTGTIESLPLAVPATGICATQSDHKMPTQSNQALLEFPAEQPNESMFKKAAAPLDPKIKRGCCCRLNSSWL
jgi:hypothetical protein